MIQRPQSLYFLGLIAISLMLLFSDTVFYSATRADETETVNVEFDETEFIAADGESKQSNTYLSMFLVGQAILAGAAIVSFKKRKLQVLLSGFNYLLTFGIVVMMYMYSLRMDYFQDGTAGLTFFAVIPLATIVFNALAIRGVKRDEQLIRSMDRLR